MRAGFYCIIRNRGPPVNNNKYKEANNLEGSGEHSQSCSPPIVGR